MSLRRHQPDHRGHSIDEQSQLPFALTQRGLRFPLIVDVFGMTIPANDPATVITRGNGRVAEPAIYAITPPEPLFTFQRRTGLDAVTPFRVDAFDIVWMKKWHSITMYIEDPTHLVGANAQIFEHRRIHELNAAVRIGIPAKARNIGNIGALVHPFIKADGPENLDDQP